MRGFYELHGYYKARPSTKYTNQKRNTSNIIKENEY